ncbi:hypothetical protein BH20ACT5_BH20ACT5_08790 [soil metagenome]
MTTETDRTSVSGAVSQLSRGGLVGHAATTTSSSGTRHNTMGARLTPLTAFVAAQDGEVGG